MMMNNEITVYLWDYNSVYAGYMDVDKYGPMPDRSTIKIPPLHPDKITMWNGMNWYNIDKTTGEVSARESEESILARISARRFDEEVGGMTVNGMWVDTSRDSQSLITGAALAATLDSNYSVKWKTGKTFVTLTAEEIIALASAVRAHVQKCFDREAELFEAVEEGKFEESMLEEGW